MTRHAAFKSTTRGISGSWHVIKKRVVLTYFIYMSSKTRSYDAPHSKAYLILKYDMPHSKAWNDSFQIRSWWHELLSRTRCYEAPSFLTNECRICESQVFSFYTCGTQVLWTRTCHICYRALLQKRPITLRSLLIVATPYDMHTSRTQELWTQTCHICKMGMSYGVATIRRLFKIIGLFCKRAL